MVLSKGFKFGYLVGGIVFALIFFSCQSEKYSPKVFDYFPLDQTQSRIYEVNESRYSLSADEQHFTYYIKEKITSVSQNSDSKTFIIQRFKSNESTKNWKLDSVWAGTLKPDRLIINQNNQEILKLIFPVTEKLEWNLNTYLNAKPKLAKYENINKAFESNKLNFENTVKVKIAEDSSLIDLKKENEYYADGVGLIYKETTNLAYCQSNPDCIGKGLISSGSSKIYKIIEIVKE